MTCLELWTTCHWVFMTWPFAADKLGSLLNQSLQQHNPRPKTRYLVSYVLWLLEVERDSLCRRTSHSCRRPLLNPNQLKRLRTSRRRELNPMFLLRMITSHRSQSDKSKQRRTNPKCTKPIYSNNSKENDSRTRTLDFIRITFYRLQSVIILRSLRFDKSVREFVFYGLIGEFRLVSIKPRPTRGKSCNF